MANQVVQIIDNNGNDIYPVAGALMQGAVTTSTINDGAVTASKIDFTTFGDNIVTILKFGHQDTQTGSMTRTTLKGTELTIEWVNYGQRFCITSGANGINRIRESYSVRPENGATVGSYLIGGLAAGSKTYTYGNAILNSSNQPNYSRTSIDVIDGTFDSYSAFIDVAGSKSFTTASVDFIRGHNDVWNGLGFAMSSGLACFASFGVECTCRSGMAPHFCQGVTGNPTNIEVIYEIFE